MYSRRCQKCVDTVKINNSSSISRRCRSSKKISRSQTTALIVSKEKLKGIIKIVNSHKDSGVMMKRVTKTIENETNNKGGIS